MKTIQAKIHYYYLSLENNARGYGTKPNAEEALQNAKTYNALCDALLKRGVKKWNTDMRNGGAVAESDYLKKIQTAAGYDGKPWPQYGVFSGTVTIETEHLFNNQWNTVEGLRVFEWHEYIYANAAIKEGYWLELPQELLTLMDNTMTCGYCGKQEPAAKGYNFCPHCLDNEYLTANDLCLTRMLPVSSNASRKALTPAERAYLLPLYKEAQLHGITERGKARIKAKIEAKKLDIEAKYKKALHAAESEYQGAKWLLSRCSKVLDNWIYYSHADKHCFGWKKPIEQELLPDLLELISEFPFPYDVKCADGRTLREGGTIS